MKTTCTRSGSRTERRTKALGVDLEYLGVWLVGLSADGLAEGSVELVAGGKRITVEGWVLDAMRRGLTEPSASEDPTAQLPAHSLALRRKIARDRASLDAVPAGSVEALYATQAELMLDSAIGMALLREMQQVIDEVVRRGRIGQAKQWTRLKNDLHAECKELKQFLAEPEHRRAVTIADNLTDQPRAETSIRKQLSPARPFAEEERLRKGRRLARRRAAQALVHLPTRTEVLLAGLILAVAVWLGFVALPAQLVDRPPSLTVADLSERDGIFLAVESRPPSLYVTVDGRSWTRLDLDARRELVRDISETAGQGYAGVLLRTDEGRPVAQWMVQSGLRLLEPGETRPVALQAKLPITDP